MTTVKNGDKINNITVINASSSQYKEPTDKVRWNALVRCDCGHEFEIRRAYLYRKGEKCPKCCTVQRRYVQIGEVYDKLTVIGFDKSSGRLQAVCKCACGNVVKRRAELLTHINKTNNCGCDHRGAWSGFGEISKTFMYRIQRNAKMRDIPCEVSIEYLWALYEEQDGKCALTGVDITFAKRTRDIGDASLDRKDSDKGYLEGNVQWVHKDVNLMKMDFPEDRFIELCKLVADNHS